MLDNYIKPNLKEIFIYDKDKQEKGFKYGFIPPPIQSAPMQKKENL
jgi:hypothetical protein